MAEPSIEGLYRQGSRRVCSAPSARRPIARRLAAALLLAASAAGAAGFDTPTLYTARHQAMGGAAIAYVDDPSAAFHNPAGLQGVRGLALLGDLSLQLAHLRGSPAPSASANGIQSDLIIAPFFLVGGAYRVASWLSFGLAVFPVASAGAEYEYPVPESAVYEYNTTELAFYEATPLLSLNVPKDAVLPGLLAFGIGYRMNFVTLLRQQGERDNPQGLDIDLNGLDFAGFRAGMQYRAGELFSVGVVYRNRVTLTTRGDEATVLGLPVTDVELPFVLPAQLGAGFRSDYDRVGVAVDAIYTFQSQVERGDLKGVIAGNPALIPNVFEWRDAWTLHLGFEFRLGPSEELPIRVGYVYDAQAGNRAYPSAFGYPASPTRTFTVGGGYAADDWEVNLALSLGGGSTIIRASELAPPNACPTCGYSGEYAISATGLYLDLSMDIEL